jgi:hypothetical protein
MPKAELLQAEAHAKTNMQRMNSNKQYICMLILQRITLSWGKAEMSMARLVFCATNFRTH